MTFKTWRVGKHRDANNSAYVPHIILIDPEDLENCKTLCYSQIICRIIHQK